MRVRLALFAILTLCIPGSVARAADLDPHLPPKTVSYARIHVKQVLASRVGKIVGADNLRGTLASLGDVDALLRHIGFDPHELESVQLAALKGEDTTGLMILTGSFDAAVLKKCEQAQKCKRLEAELADKTAQTLYEVKLGKRGAMFVAVVGNKTLLASPRKEYVIDALSQARAKKKLALEDEQLQAVLEKLDVKQSVTLAMRGSAIGKIKLLDLPGMRLIRLVLGRVEILGAAVSFGNEIKFDLAGTAKDEDRGETLRELMGKGVNLAKVGLGFLGKDNKTVVLLGEVLDTLKVGGQGKVVAVSGKLTADVLDEAFSKTDD